MNLSKNLKKSPVYIADEYLTPNTFICFKSYSLINTDHISHDHAFSHKESPLVRPPR